MKIPNKTKKTNPLQDKVSNDSQNDEAESEDAISTMSKSELQDECKRLLKKISEMEVNTNYQLSLKFTKFYIYINNYIYH